MTRVKGSVVNVVIEVSRTITEEVMVEMPTGATKAEAIALIEAEIQKEFYDDLNEVEWGWLKMPSFKDTKCPLPEHWFDTKLGKVATNGALLLLEGFPLPAEFALATGDRPWQVHDQANIYKIEDILAKDVNLLIKHEGWFAPPFKCFLTISGLTVLQEKGKADAPGYLVLGGKIVGVVMPCLPVRSDTASLFKFNQSEVTA